MGVHVFQDDMSYESICLGGVHVFRMAYLTICSVLLEDISYWMTHFTCGYVLLEGMSYSSRCFTGIHILHEGIFYWTIRHIGHLLYEDRFCWTVCIRGSHVLHEGMSCRWTYPAGVHVV